MRLQKIKPNMFMSLFPTMNSLQEVHELAESKIPITDKNELYGLLYTYHNTLLKELSKVH